MTFRPTCNNIYGRQWRFFAVLQVEPSPQSDPQTQIKTSSQTAIFYSGIHKDLEKLKNKFSATHFGSVVGKFRFWCENPYRCVTLTPNNYLICHYWNVCHPRAPKYFNMPHIALKPGYLASRGSAAVGFTKIEPFSTKLRPSKDDLQQPLETAFTAEGEDPDFTQVSWLSAPIRPAETALISLKI